MSDARWLDVDDDLRSAVGHFTRSVEIFERGGFSGDDLQAYIGRMALMQAMQSGYTSLEAAFERILEILGRKSRPARTITPICCDVSVERFRETGHR